MFLFHFKYMMLTQSNCLFYIVFSFTFHIQVCIDFHNTITKKNIMIIIHFLHNSCSLFIWQKTNICSIYCIYYKLKLTCLGNKTFMNIRWIDLFWNSIIYKLPFLKRFSVSPKLECSTSGWLCTKASRQCFLIFII